MSDAKQVSSRRYWGGILALSGVVLIWVTSSFAMNSLFGELNYNKPFLVTYLNTATFSFYLLPFLLKRSKRSKKLLNNQSTKTYAAVQSTSTATEKLSTVQTIQLSLTFCILWFFANYTTNASLAYTTVGSSTILSAMSGLFTLAFGVLFKVEQLNVIKCAAVLISFLGVILVSYSDHINDHTQASSPLIGDVLALSGAFFYGCYTILLKLKIGNEDRIDMPLFFGFVGAFNILLLWPLMPIFHYLGLETFELPMNSTLWAVIFLNAFIGTFLSDYLWLLAMLMTSPLVVTLGIALTTPLALIGEIFFKGIIPNLRYSLGALFILSGFLAINTNALKEAKSRNQETLLN